MMKQVERKEGLFFLKRKIFFVERARAPRSIRAPSGQTVEQYILPNTSVTESQKASTARLRESVAGISCSEANHKPIFVLATPYRTAAAVMKNAAAASRVIRRN